MTTPKHPRPWRQGRKVPRNIYDANDQPIVMMPDEGTASEVVAAINAQETPAPTGGELGAASPPVGSPVIPTEAVTVEAKGEPSLLREPVKLPLTKPEWDPNTDPRRCPAVNELGQRCCLVRHGTDIQHWAISGHWGELPARETGPGEVGDEPSDEELELLAGTAYSARVAARLLERAGCSLADEGQFAACRALFNAGRSSNAALVQAAEGRMKLALEALRNARDKADDRSIDLEAAYRHLDEGIMQALADLRGEPRHMKEPMPATRVRSG